MEKDWSSSIRLRIIEPGYECRQYLGLSHSLMPLMGFPMRYPRLLTVCFVAFALVLSPTTDARAPSRRAASCPARSPTCARQHWPKGRNTTSAFRTKASSKSGLRSIEPLCLRGRALRRHIREVALSRCRVCSR